MFFSVITLTILTDLFAFVIHVPEDFSTIQEGIDNTTFGDTVLVASGVYIENINIPEGIVLGSNYLTTQDTSFISSTIIDSSYVQ